MKRTFLLLCLPAVLLAIPQVASARVVELGAKNPAASPSCPTDPCEVLARVTGYPGRAGSVKNPYLIRRDGYLVAFTVPLGAPTAQQATYFTDDPTGPRFGEPQVRLSILRKGDTRKTRLDHRLVGQSPAFDVADYFGSTPTFVLQDPIRVKKGNIVALTSPTWAPSFANSVAGGASWWRSSRAKKRCEAPQSLQQYSMTTLRAISVFGCTYHGARPLYTVTYVPDNRTTVKEGQ
jgi:hypothetical protein